LHLLPQEAALTVANNNLKVFLFLFSSSTFWNHDSSSALIPAHVPNSLVTALASPTTFPAAFTNWWHVWSCVEISVNTQNNILTVPCLASTIKWGVCQQCRSLPLLLSFLLSILPHTYRTCWPSWPHLSCCNHLCPSFPPTLVAMACLRCMSEALCPW
jgi:hypothetical protein